MPAYSRAITENKIVWLAPLMVLVACSGSEDTNFFKPRSGGGSSSGGSGGTVGGTDMGGSAGGGTTSVGGASGDANGGSAGQSGGTGAMGGSEPQGGSSAGDGMGGAPIGGTAGQSGDAGSGVSGDAGMAGAGMAGTQGAGMGGGGMGGAGMAGAGMGGAGMGGAGMGGAGKGGNAGASGCVPTVPSTERCDGVDNNCMGGIDEGMICPTGCTGATRAGHYYIFCSFEDASSGMATRFRTWTQAQDFCTQRSTSLVFIESAEEDAFILDWITRLGLQDQVWTGGNDRDPTLGTNEGEWVWGTGNNAVQFWDGDENGMAVMNRYEDWAGGEPNNMGNEDCAVLSSDHDFHWDDRVCTNQYLNFVCESTTPATTN